MFSLDPAVVRVAHSADHIPGLVNAEHVGQCKIVTRDKVFVIKTGLTAGHERSARSNVVPDLIALLFAKHRDVGQQERAILAKVLMIEPVFVYKVKSETPSEERVVNALDCVMHVCA